MIEISGDVRSRIAHALTFTNVYRRYASAHPALREAHCLRAQFPALLMPIGDDALFAGRSMTGLVGIKFSFDEGEMGYYCHTGEIASLAQHPNLDAGDWASLEELMAFWRQHTTFARAQVLDTGARFPPAVRNALLMPGEGKNWEEENFAATYMPRMAEITLDFDTLLRAGVPGLRAKVRHAQAGAANEDSAALYTGMLLALDLFDDVAEEYAAQAGDLARRTDDAARRRDLDRMAAALQAITERAPTSLYEAIQLCWLYGILAGIDNFGRMDVYLGDFLADDLATGRLCEDEADRLIQALWRQIGEIYPWSGRVIIGGYGRRNVEHADGFALIALEATRKVCLHSPQLSLRWHQGMPEAIWEKALEVIGVGRNFPLLYNDDIYVPAVAAAYDIPVQDAEQYVLSNCGEIGLDHRAINSPNGSINYTKLLELTLFNGVDPVSGKPMGWPTSTNLHSFDELWDAYEHQVSATVELITDRMVCLYAAMDAHAPHLYASMLFDDCLAHELGLFSGARYRGFDVETHTAISVADSLTAVKQVVFEQQAFSFEELLVMLRANFHGYAEQRRLLLTAPKFGNDDPQADEMAIAVCHMINSHTRAQAARLGLDFCLPSHISVNAYLYLGKHTGATPDGRLAGCPLSNGYNPLAGNDRQGVTALLHSMAKLTPAETAGQAHHLKLARALLTQREMTSVLLRTFFAQGGAYLCIDVTDGQELEDALAHPEAHANLFVRVGGFSARFIDLPRELQQEVIARTLHMG